MAERRTSYDIAGTRHSGTKCEDCSTSYAACSRNLLEKGKRACCGRCEYTDTHDVRTVGPVTARKATPKTPPKEETILDGIDLYDLRSTLEELENVETQLNGFGTLVDMTVVIEFHNHKLTARYADRKWSLTTGKAT